MFSISVAVSTRKIGLRSSLFFPPPSQLPGPSTLSGTSLLAGLTLKNQSQSFCPLILWEQPAKLMVLSSLSSSASKPSELGCYFLLHGLKTQMLLLVDPCRHGEVKGNELTGELASLECGHWGAVGPPVLQCSAPAGKDEEISTAWVGNVDCC